MSSELLKDFPSFREKFPINLLENTPSKRIILWQNTGLLKVHLPELDKCCGVVQDPKYHTLDVFEHCVKTCDFTPAIDYMRWAGLLHDIGKVLTRKVRVMCKKAFPKRSSFSECPWTKKPCHLNCSHGIIRITFHKHEMASIKLAKKVLKRYKVTSDVYHKTLHLVANHMYNFSSNWTDRAIKRFIDRTGLTQEDLLEPDSFPLFRLRIADRLSRGLKPVTQRQRDFEQRLREFFAKIQP
jgi:putative nucleotidyltransferase with HDIG domain